MQVVSTLLSYGPEELTNLRRNFALWLEEHEYDSLEQMKGSMNRPGGVEFCKTL